MENNLGTVLGFALFFLPLMCFFECKGDFEIQNFGDQYTNEHGKTWQWIHAVIILSLSFICSIRFFINLDEANTNIQWIICIVGLIFILAFIIDEANIQRMIHTYRHN